jgi:hypothetical protein
MNAWSYASGMWYVDRLYTYLQIKYEPLFVNSDKLVRFEVITAVKVAMFSWVVTPSVTNISTRRCEYFRLYLRNLT